MQPIQSAPGYSFVIPAYNDVEGLTRHLEYFAACSARVQLVIVDDCSEDNTAEQMAVAQTPDNVRLTYMRLEQNSGPAAARNQGLRVAEEDWVLFLDADDLLAPCFFPIMDFATQLPGCDFLMFKYHLATRSDARFTYEMHAVDRVFFSERSHGRFPMSQVRLNERPEALKTVNFPWNKLYRREFLMEKGIYFPEDMRMHEDILPHWQSFLESSMFGVLDWAPPLITHFEVQGGDRATQYIGEKRLSVFRSLGLVEKCVRFHPEGKNLELAFVSFCDGLFDWMTDGLFVGANSDDVHWRQRYQHEIERFWAESDLSGLLSEIQI